MAKCQLTRKKTRVTKINRTRVTKECARRQLDCTKEEQRAKRFFWWTRVCRRKERLVATKMKATSPTKSRWWASRVTTRSTVGPSRTMAVAQRLTNAARTDRKSFLIQHLSMRVIPQTKMGKVSWTTDKFSSNGSTPAPCMRNWTSLAQVLAIWPLVWSKRARTLPPQTATTHSPWVPSQDTAIRRTRSPNSEFSADSWIELLKLIKKKSQPSQWTWLKPMAPKTTCPHI